MVEEKKYSIRIKIGRQSTLHFTIFHSAAITSPLALILFFVLYIISEVNSMHERNIFIVYI